MNEKDPFTTYSWVTYAWVLGLSCVAGLSSFLGKVKRGEARATNIVEFIGEIVTAALVGLVTFWLCESANFSHLITAALVAITGHMGTRAMYIAEKTLEKRLRKFSGETENEKE